MQHVDIVVHTPPYHDQRITEPQTVAIQIRLIDNTISNTVKYTYTPQAKGRSTDEAVMETTIKYPTGQFTASCKMPCADVHCAKASLAKLPMIVIVLHGTNKAFI